MDEKVNFEKSIEDLELIISTLESGKLSLNESLELFEKGTSIIADCNKALDEAEQKVFQLTRNSSGDLIKDSFKEE